MNYLEIERTERLCDHLHLIGFLIRQNLTHKTLLVFIQCIDTNVPIQPFDWKLIINLILMWVSIHFHDSIRQSIVL